MFNGQTCTVQRSMRRDLDGHLILNDGRNAMLGAGCGDSIGTHAANAQCNDANGAAEGHTADNVPLACVVFGAVSLQMSLNDLAFLPGIVDGRGGHSDADEGYAGRQGEGQPGHGSRGGGAGDQAGVMLPFPLQLFRVHDGAFRVVGLVVERHLGWCSRDRDGVQDAWPFPASQANRATAMAFIAPGFQQADNEQE